MRQGRMQFPAKAAVACLMCAMLAAFASAGSPARAASNPSATPKSAQSKGATTRQFTGYVTMFDKSTLTVEKRGKAPRTVRFDRDPEMKTTGELEKDARVTVYYRDEDGQSIAHRVVVKTRASGEATASHGAAAHTSR